MTSKEILAANLKQYRDKYDISQEELAYAAGLSTRGYGEIERGKVNTSLDKIDRLSDATGISVDQLLFDELDLSKKKEE